MKDEDKIGNSSAPGAGALARKKAPSHLLKENIELRKLLSDWAVYDRDWRAFASRALSPAPKSSQGEFDDWFIEMSRRLTDLNRRRERILHQEEPKEEVSVQ